MAVFVPTGQVYGHKLIVFVGEGFELFAGIESSFHYWWVIRRGSTMRTDAVYTPSDCFETFPFPGVGPADIGEMLHDLRCGAMRVYDVGLTGLLQKINDRVCSDPTVKGLRDLQVRLDRAVAAAYGWNDLDLGHGFHETRQGVRFTISEHARQTVLDRLLALNHQRHAEEEAAAELARQAKPARTRAGKAKLKADSPTLF
jgi:hypothetical protein